MNNPCTFYIVRHAESEANIQKRYAGNFDAPLTENGHLQAQEMAKQFKNIHFDAAFSSDLSRSYNTAQIIANEHTVAVVAKKLLREKSHGIVEGKRHDELEEDIRKKMDVYHALDADAMWTHKAVEGMESLEETAGRFITFLRETALAYPNKTLLIVSHGGSMRSLLAHLGFASIKELPSTSAANASYIVLKSDGVEFEIAKIVGIEKK
ncbi:MAG TPA: histidine phosphatase family protein [Candidatus Eisenbacteria bacterium]|nr:histidine phosphatase family protein [Candidatus Eisenbacteria bacterium]